LFHDRQPHCILYRERVKPRTNSYEVVLSGTYKSHIKLSAEVDGREFNEIHNVETEIYKKQEVN
jgi:ABC-type molybdenum transport system ATPase subunit/photorepair protein PhrA